MIFIFIYIYIIHKHSAKPSILFLRRFQRLRQPLLQKILCLLRDYRLWYQDFVLIFPKQQYDLLLDQQHVSNPFSIFKKLFKKWLEFHPIILFISDLKKPSRTAVPSGVFQSSPKIVKHSLRPTATCAM